MVRFRLPLAALALLLLAACQSAAPTAPEAPRTLNSSAAGGDSAITTGGADRGGTGIGSGN
jgi:hypothetical protein